MGADKSPGTKKIKLRTNAKRANNVTRQLSVVPRSVENTADAPPVRNNSAARRSNNLSISNLAEIPIPERLLSDKSKASGEDKHFVFGEQVQNKAIVFRASNGSIWLLYCDDLSEAQLLELHATKSEIKQSDQPFVFAKCPAPIFEEFTQKAYDWQRKKQASLDSAQHKHFESLVLDAVDHEVSDIHITVSRGNVTVEYRIDSRNQIINKFSWSVSVEQTTSLVRSVFNTIAGNTNKSWNPRVPQDASIIHTIKGQSYQLRYAHDNVEGDGFHVVLRVLDDLSDRGDESEEASFVPLQKLGLYDDEAETVARMMESPFGLVCVSGTTGSGKSTFLKNTIGAYAYKNPGKNIITVENPVEYRIFNAKQTSVSDAEHMGAHLVSVLRRDPDAILIGEIRDQQSAKVAIEATQTGHFVWATLHASNALAQAARLEDIGISRLTLAAPEFMAGMIHLALSRKVCTGCRVPITTALQKDLVPRDRFERVRVALNGEISSVYVANPSGCSKCQGSAGETRIDVNAGFKGRMSVIETVFPTIKILKAIKDGDDLGAYEAWRETGGITLQEAAIRRLKDGHLCANEVEGQFKRLDHDKVFYG